MVRANQPGRKVATSASKRAHREGAQGGVGLGLTLCRAIVEAHGGWIRAKNRGTGGAVFTFTLPLEQAPPAAKPDAPPPETV